MYNFRSYKGVVNLKFVKENKIKDYWLLYNII